MARYEYEKWYGNTYESYYVPPVQNYVSMRITCPHDEWEIIERKVLFDSPWYISYPHFGKNKNNEHYHVFVPGGKKDATRYRERCKSHAYSGNKHLSIKCLENSILQAISYGAREGTEPITRGPHTRCWIRWAPEWQNARLYENLNPTTGPGEKRKREDEEGIRVTQRNFMRLAFNYRRDHGIHSTDVADVFIHMFAHGYYLCPTFARQGMPTFYLDVFKDSCEKGYLTWRGTKFIWKNVVFRDSRF